MSSFNDTPLSNHEIFEAKALIKRYEEAAAQSLRVEAPFWMQVSAMSNYHRSRMDLVVALEKGKNYDVRRAITYPSKLPENGEAA